MAGYPSFAARVFGKVFKALLFIILVWIVLLFGILVFENGALDWIAKEYEMWTMPGDTAPVHYYTRPSDGTKLEYRIFDLTNDSDFANVFVNPSMTKMPCHYMVKHLDKSMRKIRREYTDPLTFCVTDPGNLVDFLARKKKNDDVKSQIQVLSEDLDAFIDELHRTYPQLKEMRKILGALQHHTEKDMERAKLRKEREAAYDENLRQQILAEESEMKQNKEQIGSEGQAAKEL